MGSGETAPSSQRIYSWLMQRLAPPMRVAILETPAGFQPNSAQVADEIAAYIAKHLVNFRPESQRVEARARHSSHSPDDESLLAPLRESNLLLLGPGSPTYAARQLAGSLAWEWLQARHRLGAGLLLSSAGT
ncbi:MAG: cysteinyl-tRNA synthetase, partial [Caldilineaceae bacterium]